MQHLQMTEADIRAALVRTGRVPEGDPDGIGDVIVGLMNGSVAMKDVQGIDDDELESVYALAYNHFRAGKLDEAEKLLAFVCMFEHRSSKYWLGLGAVRFGQGNHEGALSAYAASAMADPDDPRPPLRAADCQLALGNRDEAKAALEMAIENSGDDPKHAVVRQRAEALIDLIDKGAATAATAQ